MALPPTESSHSWIDWNRIGIGLSGLCTVHCLVIPLVLSVLPLWPALSALHAWLHPIFIVLLLPVTYAAMRDARRHHNDRWIPLLLGLGFAAITMAWLGHVLWDHTGETIGTLLGSALLITGHTLNWRRHRSGCSSCTPTPESDTAS